MMSNFDAMRRLLDERWPDLAALADDPRQFTREMQSLRRLWEREEDARLLAEETEEVLARHPRVRAVVDAVLDGDLSASAPASAAPPVPRPVVADRRAVQPGPVPEPESPIMTPVPVVAEPSPEVAPWDNRLAIAKEIVIGVLGVVIVLTTVGMLVTAFLRTGSDDASWTRMKDVLLYMTGLAGVVLGYYFGRVPSELRANSAERAAEHARREAREAKAELEQLRATTGR